MEGGRTPRNPEALEKNNVMETEVTGDRIVSHVGEEEIMRAMTVLVVLVAAMTSQRSAKEAHQVVNLQPSLI